MNEHNILELNSVAQCNEYLGVPTLHRHISVVDLSKIDIIQHQPKKMGLFIVACHKMSDATGYVMRFYTPGQLGIFNSGTTINPTGWVLIFDSVLLENTLLANRMREYPFFKPKAFTSLSLNHNE